MCNVAVRHKTIAQHNADKQNIENVAAIVKAETDKHVLSPTPRK